LSTYLYTDANPINLTDPDGRETRTPVVAGPARRTPIAAGPEQREPIAVGPVAGSNKPRAETVFSADIDFRQRAQAVVDFAKTHNGRALYRKEAWRNDGRGGTAKLPSMTPGGQPIVYHSYDIFPTRGDVRRGEYRVLMGSDGSARITTGHYAPGSFQFIGPAPAGTPVEAEIKPRTQTNRTGPGGGHAMNVGLILWTVIEGAYDRQQQRRRENFGQDLRNWAADMDARAAGTFYPPPHTPMSLTNPGSVPIVEIGGGTL
ncbi:hypothetical protein, partial [Kribbella deserti]